MPASRRTQLSDATALLCWRVDMTAGAAVRRSHRGWLRAMAAIRSFLHLHVQEGAPPETRYQLKPAPADMLRSSPEKPADSETLARGPTRRW